MPVYVALFGEQNYEWPECLHRSTIATPTDSDDFKYILSRDKAGFIQHRMKGVSSRGNQVNFGTASRWFNTKITFLDSVGDIWVHKDKASNRIWWTRTTDEPAEFIPKTEPVGRKCEVLVCHKPCEPWRSVSWIGRELIWTDLHPKARGILNTPMTLITLSGDNEAYILALLQGEDLSPWHDRPDWRALAGPNWKDADADLTALDRAVARMAQMAYQTSLQSNGQKVLTTRKNKDFGFPDPKTMEPYLRELLNQQGNRCALSGLPLSFDGPDVDREMRPSLDRIDSNGHYAKSNLQVVAHFMNRWKGAYDNEEFKRLLKVLRG